MSALNTAAVLSILTLDTSKFSKGLTEAKKQLQKFGKDGATATEKIDALQKMMSAVGQDLTRTVTAPVVALGTTAVKAFAGFDDAMRQVQATMGATAEESAKLAAAAKEAGATTRYTASEAAEALNYLALAGYDADTAIESMPQVLRLAQAGAIDLAYASDMLTDSMAALGKDTSYMEEFSDQMVKTSQRSNTSVSQLGEAILTIGGTAKVLAGDTVELNTALGLLADNGIKGSEGGTKLRNVILSLTAPTEKASKQMAKLGLDVFDAEGNMRPLQEIITDLNKAMDGMTDEEKQNIITKIFNKRDLDAVTALMGTTVERWEQLTGEIENSSGVAQEVAETMEGGIGGAFRNLSSAVEAVAIEFGENMAPMVQNVAEKVTGLARGFAGLSEGTQDMIVRVAALAAAAGPALVLGSKAITLAKGVATAMSGPAGIVVGIAAVAAGIYALHKAWQENHDMETGINRILNGADKEVTGSMKATYETTVQLTGATTGGTVMDEIMAQLPTLYDAISEKLTDGEVDSKEDMTKLKADVHDYYDQQRAIVQSEIDAAIAGLNTSSETYDADVLALQTKADAMVTELNALENQSIAWIDANANRSTAAVKSHMDELDAIEARAAVVQQEIADTIAAEKSYDEMLVSRAKQGDVTDAEHLAQAFGIVGRQTAANEENIKAEYAAAYEEAVKNGGDLDAVNAAEKEALQRNAEAGKQEMAEIIAGYMESLPEEVQDQAENVQKWNLLNMLTDYMGTDGFDKDAFRQTLDSSQTLSDAVMEAWKESTGEGITYDELLNMENMAPIGMAVSSYLDGLETEIVQGMKGKTGLLDEIFQLLTDEGVYSEDELKAMTPIEKYATLMGEELEQIDIPGIMEAGATAAGAAVPASYAAAMLEELPAVHDAAQIIADDVAATLTGGWNRGMAHAGGGNGTNVTNTGGNSTVTVNNFNGNYNGRLIKRSVSLYEGSVARGYGG